VASGAGDVTGTDPVGGFAARETPVVGGAGGVAGADPIAGRGGSGGAGSGFGVADGGMTAVLLARDGGVTGVATIGGFDGGETPAAGGTGNVPEMGPVVLFAGTNEGVNDEGTTGVALTSGLGAGEIAGAGGSTAGTAVTGGFDAGGIVGVGGSTGADT